MNMIKMPRSQSSSIKHMIYPEVKKSNPTFHKNNMTALKQLQAENKTKRDEKENHVAAQPYKLKEFTSIPSKVFKMISSTNREQNYASEQLNSNAKTTYTSNNRLQAPMNKVKSTFVSKSVNKTVKNSRSEKEENIFALGQVEEDLKQEYTELKRLMKNKPIREEAEVKNAKKKGPTPKANEINILPPRIHKDHISENRMKVTQNEIPIKVLKKEEDALIHKNFGKTPEYLVKYKQDAEDKKELEKRKAEESKYPKGTRLLSEDERAETLNSLIESRKEIMSLCEKMPISMRTISMQNRKTELETKLSEIENAIKTFSRKQVFIKTDN